MAVKSASNRDVISRLKQDLLRWQGFVSPESPAASRIGLGPVEEAFPNGVFPVGSVHEFISASKEETAASNGFIGGLLAALMGSSGVCIWISALRAVFPPAIKAFGVDPDRIVFVDMASERDILWAMEEALKCQGLAAVVAELRELDFVQSRRLQLAVEKSRVTGFVLRNNPRRMGTTACAARWQIRPVASELQEGLPGVGFPRWEVELLKVRNGNPGCWTMEWSGRDFVPVDRPMQTAILPNWDRKSG